MTARIWFGTLLCSAALALSARGSLIINESDSDSVNTPTTDAFEFVELFETTGTSVPLDGYVLVFYNGNGNVVYRAEDLDGLTTRANGYFIAGSIAGAERNIPGNTIQNGVDAIALYLGNATDFPNGQGVSAAPASTTLIDAVVYKTGNDTDGIGLDTALLVAGPIVDEFGRDGTATAGAADSIGRIPNGSGNVRNTTNWTFMTPTPGAANTAPVPEPAGLVLLATIGTVVGCRRKNRG
jgi:hypothetical protein